MNWADTSASAFCFFCFFSRVFQIAATVHHCSINSSSKLWLFKFFDQSLHIVYCLWTHKFHFSVTFLLQMGPTVLFTHLKIILLQCFSVFSFQLYPNGPLFCWNTVLITIESETIQFWMALDSICYRLLQRSPQTSKLDWLIICNLEYHEWYLLLFIYEFIIVHMS